MSKKKVCSHCGKITSYNEVCSCFNDRPKNKKVVKNYEEVCKPLHTKRWKKLRKLIIERDNCCCQRCLIKYGIINSKNLEVHHIKPRSEFPELLFEETNLITLCKTCNTQYGTNAELDFIPNIKTEDFNL